MLYRGKAIEVLGEKEVFGKTIAWIRILEDGSFLQVAKEDLEPENVEFNIPLIRFISIAAKIKDEVAKKNILAPYESSLIPLPHQILVLEKVMQSTQNRYLLADEVGMGKTIERTRDNHETTTHASNDRENQKQSRNNHTCVKINM